MNMINHSFSWRRALLLAAAALAASVLGAEETIPAPPDVGAPPADAERTESGLATKVLEPGTGDYRPGALDVVEVHYTGWTTDGKMFDSSVARGKPDGVRLEHLVPGWSEGIQLMVKGEKRRFWIPEELAYAGQEGKPEGMLVFDVELLRYQRFTPSPVPENVATPPPEAEVTDSGLASIVLKQGTGADRPRSRSTVTVHYTGWTTDGEMFDSSIPRGKPIAFPLTDVIKGWREGLQLMAAGEHRRFWIPEKLAYKGRKGKPQGILVFDIELLAIGN